MVLLSKRLKLSYPPMIFLMGKLDSFFMVYYLTNDRLTYGSSVRLKGSWSGSPGPAQDMGLKVKELQVFGECDPEVTL